MKVWFYIILSFIIILKVFLSVWEKHKNSRHESDYPRQYHTNTYPHYFPSQNRDDDSEVTGKKGEQRLVDKLMTLEGNKRIIRNCYIPTDTGTTEIDVIMVHENGIYVFESKNYSGWIYGNTDCEKWTHTLRHRDRNGFKTEKYHFFNPIMQNKTHVKWLKKYLSDKTEIKIPIYSVIVFGDNCKIKTPIEASGDSIITYCRDITSSLISAGYSLQDRLSKETIECIYDLLVPLANVTSDIREKHIANIQYKYGKEVGA